MLFNEGKEVHSNIKFAWKNRKCKNLSNKLIFREKNTNHVMVVQNMKKVLEAFPHDWAKDTSSFYILLNKLNNDSKWNPDVREKLEKLKSSLFREKILAKPMS